MRCEVLTVTKAQTAVFWVVTLSSLQVIANILVKNAASIFKVKEPADTDSVFLQNFAMTYNKKMSQSRRIQS
jgi:hypothetical protein